MGTRLWNSFKTMNEANVYINSIIEGDMSIEYSYESNINFTINGTIISNILELDSDNNKNIFVFENNGCNSLIILINQNENENNLFTKNIWNWKVFFCLLVDNYFMIDDTNPILEKTILSSDFKINGLDSLNSFYNILHNNLDWKSFKNEIKQISKNTTKNIDTINQAIETAFRIILIGNNDTFKNNNIITEIDGEHIYSFNIDTISLSIYKHIDSYAKKGKHKYVLFQFTDIVKKQKKTHDYTNTFVVDGIPLTFLLQNGLLDKLNSFFDTTNSGLHIVYEKKNNITKIFIEW